MGKPLKISEEAAVQMPMKTVASLIAMVAIGTWAYFGIIETQNRMETTLKLMETDVVENTEFRIKWPRGQLGSLPADSEQFMMIEDLYKTTDKLNTHIESMALNKVNIEFLRKQMDKVLTDIEKLNTHSTQLQIMEKDLTENTEFRIKWPRGLLGSLPADSEQFMLIEHMSGQVEKIETAMQDMMSNTVNIERLQKDVEKILSDIEKLKDKQRNFANGDHQ